MAVVEENPLLEGLELARTPEPCALVVTKGEGVAVVNSDKQLYEFVSQLQKYQLSDEPRATVAETLASPFIRFVNFGQGLGLLGDALTAENAEKFLENYSAVALVGQSAPTFFVGMFANLIPLPGGVGAVDAGMLGAVTRQQRKIEGQIGFTGASGGVEERLMGAVDKGVQEKGHVG